MCIIINRLYYSFILRWASWYIRTHFITLFTFQYSSILINCWFCALVTLVWVLCNCLLIWVIVIFIHWIKLERYLMRSHWIRIFFLYCLFKIVYFQWFTISLTQPFLSLNWWKVIHLIEFLWSYIFRQSFYFILI